MKPISKPTVNTQIQRMNGLQRGAEVFRYIVLKAEFWISPDGKAREWVKGNARLSLLLAAPTFLTFPVVTVALWELEAWTDALTSIATKLIVLPFLVLLALASITFVCRISSAFKR